MSEEITSDQIENHKFYGNVPQTIFIEISSIKFDFACYHIF